ncbi:hypothetical protein SLS58_009409 [Diplodia intermedia]|uniref:FAD-binding domain-containing protein n=1 Tax=Diplodia intermedia TaxID=856260 RepID=A0ABR3TCR7_9PEZI
MGSANVESHARVLKPKVLIVGSGPIGATYARKLVDAGIDVLMIEMGAQVVQGGLELLSVPVDKFHGVNLDPTSWSTRKNIRNNQNPLQEAHDNLPVAAATRTVGGMGSHWTCCTPEQHPALERSDLFTPTQWASLYAEAKALMKTNSTSFDASIRQQLVLRVLREAHEGQGRGFQALPLACERRGEGNADYVEWSCAATVLGKIATGDEGKGKGLFELRSSWQCVELLREDCTGRVRGALVKDLLEDEYVLVEAERAEEGSLPALGHYLTEQIMTFCQVVLKRSLVESVKDDPWHLGWDKIVKEHQQKWPEDPLPFPFNDPDPQVWMPVTEARPWHAQIHRDAFSYGQTPADIDQRTVVDFRFYSAVQPIYSNYVDFSEKIRDGYNMPQPTFHFQVPDEDAETAHLMMKE